MLEAGIKAPNFTLPDKDGNFNYLDHDMDVSKFRRNYGFINICTTKRNGERYEY